MSAAGQRLGSRGRVQGGGMTCGSGGMQTAPSLAVTEAHADHTGNRNRVVVGNHNRAPSLCGSHLVLKEGRRVTEEVEGCQLTWPRVTVC